MKIHVKRLDHVQICIPFGAEDEARAFYTDLLGFTEIEKPDSLKANGGLWYQVGDIELHIGVEDRDGYNSKSHPAFEVENIDEVRRYLEENGVPTKDEKPIPGVKRFSFRDPFHNRIEFLSKR
ncbi:glyoxalase/bleomycin resistance protein/dioxygenase [Parageobacillus genomosp. 1]|uniref:Glyoxalase/bleomycin resistance protein/dioxygenase n=1 Tax=Parageobacillus genomosp. 1 TaxID=1295642 RepID=A0ABC9VC01_9BACL|nr:VOC family protein [Parageobacillus genomosp. 1]EZP75821.1 glyoxalase/bleomycin resistance protein/dioxygenase [Parageobacillus genomosp. 1]